MTGRMVGRRGRLYTCKVGGGGVALPREEGVRVVGWEMGWWGGEVIEEWATRARGISRGARYTKLTHHITTI